MRHTFGQRLGTVYQQVFGFSSLEGGTLQTGSRVLHPLEVLGGQVLLLFKKGSCATTAVLPGGTIPSLRRVEVRQQVVAVGEDGGQPSGVEEHHDVVPAEAALAGVVAAMAGVDFPCRPTPAAGQ